MSEMKIETIFNIELEFELTPLHKRILAYLIDILILLAYLNLMKYILYDLMNLRINNHIGLDMLLISLPMLLYPLICEVYLNGQSIGKKILKIRVISLSGGEPTISQYITRWATRFFEWPFLFGFILNEDVVILIYLFITSLLGIGVVVIILITNNHQRLGDLAADTVIVNTKSNLSVNDTIFMEINHADYKVTYPEVMKLSDTDINTIQKVLNQSYKYGDEIAAKVTNRVCEVLHIQTNLSSKDFLEKLIEDYNYLATRE